jgi:hypothetical protein
MHTHHLMENESMISDNTQEPNSEQLLKLLEAQVAAARARRAERETSRSKAGAIGLFLIIGGAMIALWMLMMLLEQMRPERGGRGNSASAQPVERAR